MFSAHSGQKYEFVTILIVQFECQSCAGCCKRLLFQQDPVPENLGSKIRNESN